MRGDVPETAKPYTDQVVRLHRALSSLEGWSFGRWLEFAVIGYGDDLNICLGGWTEIKGLGNLPGIRDFAEKLNAAMRPVIDDYTKQLRQELASECTKIATKALGEE